MNMRFKALLLTSLLALFLAVSCSDDSTAPEEKGTVSGTVNFIGTWPPTGEIQVSMYAELAPGFIPTGAPNSASEPIAQTNSYNFTFEGLDDGEFEAIYVSWRNPQNPSATRLIGMYWSNPDSSGIELFEVAPTVFVPAPVQPPSTVTIDSDNRTVSGIVLTADVDLWQ